MIPAHTIHHISHKTSGAVDTVWVRHVSGGLSSVNLKSYEQGREAYQGTSIEVIWLVRMERPTPIRSPWVTLRVEGLHNAEPHAKEPIMNKVRFVGLDVHAETIAVAVAEAEGEVRSLGMIPNRPASIRRLVKKLGPPEDAAAPDVGEDRAFGARRTGGDVAG